MRVIHDPGELGPERGKWCAAIGFFDGVHLGHQQIIRQAVHDARRHEANSLSQKLRVIESLGANVLWLIHFDLAFSRQTGEEFVRRLVRDFGQIRSVSVGANFVFGHKRSGNVDLLRKLGTELNLAVHGQAAVSLDGRAVSSTS